MRVFPPRAAIGAVRVVIKPERLQPGGQAAALPLAAGFGLTETPSLGGLSEGFAVGAGRLLGEGTTDRLGAGGRCLVRGISTEDRRHLCAATPAGTTGQVRLGVGSTVGAVAGG